jgi:hypothetical protein
LERRPSRRDSDDVAGRSLYLQRLDATVLPQHQVAGGWLCTLVATAPGRRLPTGICLVEDLELTRALDVVDPWHPHVNLSADDYIDLWLVQATNRTPGPHQLARAICAFVDRELFQVMTSPHANPRFGAAAGLGRYRPAVQLGCRRLVDEGLLVALFDDEQTDPRLPYGLTVPRVPWTA